MEKSESNNKLGIDLELFNLSNDDYASALFDIIKKIESLGSVISSLAGDPSGNGHEPLIWYGEDLGSIIADYSRHAYRIIDKVVWPMLSEHSRLEAESALKLVKPTR
ncbi:MAG: hypothetical protein KKF30_03445 [Proteobacteria bacterium]|nr:hypothetical protein [Pseudomonadota bacterium]MBU4471157.1 hypothetical protein [Pseudomonadota bacterium]MCG2751830.1 hypothetical protein [Desulfobacteraceae bacterium]